MISAVCPKCRASFELDDEFGGMTVQCGACSAEFAVAAVVPAAPLEPQSIDVVCPGCRTTHQVPSEARGAEAECMVCQIFFSIPQTGNQGIPVGPLPPPVPAPAAAPARPSPFAAAPAPAPMGGGASGLGAGAGIDYKNTSTIRLTRSSMFNANGTKPATPFGSPLIPPAPPPKGTPPPAAAPVPAPVAAPAPAPAPAPATAAQLPPKATPSGRIGGKKMTPPARPMKNVGQAAAGRALTGSQALAGAPAAAPPPPEPVERDEVPVVDLILALVPVLLIPVAVLATTKFGPGLAAGLGGGVGLLAWLGLLFRSMAMRGK